MKEQRELPELKIEGADFIIDVAFSTIRDKEHPENRASFTDMEIEGSNYVIYIDPQSKAISEDQYGQSEKRLIPQMVKLDPQGICIRHGLSPDELPDSDNKLRCDPLLVRQRLEKGMLPRIKVLDKDYFVDVRLGELRSVDDFMDRINLDALPMNQSDNYAYFYDTANKKTVEFDVDTITEKPENTVLVEIPNELWLDPIGTARKYGSEELSFIDRYPLQHQLQARIYPLEKTRLADYIEANLAKKAAETEEIKPAKSKRRGQGM